MNYHIKVLGVLQVFFNVQCGHAAAARGSNRLAISGILYIAASKHAGDIGGR